MIIHRFQQPVRPNSYDPETRTGTAVIASDGAVEGIRIDFDSFFVDGFPNSLPLQPDHNPAVTEKRGEWFDFKIERNEAGKKFLVASFRLSKRADNEALHTLLTEGMAPAVSISFRVTEWRTNTDAATGQKVRIAHRGKLVEASFVNSPADPTSQLRNMTMPKTNPDLQAEAVRMTPEQWDTICRAAGIPDEIRISLRDSEAEDSDKMKIALAATERSATPVGTTIKHNDQTLDNPGNLRMAVIDFYDTINRGEQPTGPAAEVFANGERGLAERICRSAGISTVGLTDQELIRRAATTSDFAIIAGGTHNLAMRRELEAAASPIASLFGRDTVGTFNAETRALADWTSLAIADKLESGEYKHSFITESGETVQVAVIGGITSKSYELNINAGSRLGNEGTQFGRRMAAEVADRQVAYLEQASHAGPTMKDTNPVFHASRGNIQDFTVDAATEVRQLMLLRSGMAKRKGAGDVMIGQYPTDWLVHSDFEETALRLLSQVQASAVADVNPMAGKLKITVEPRLSDPDTSWLVVDPAKMDGAVRVFLQGQEAPFTDSRINFDTDAVQFKIRHPFGLGWLEWRSWTRLDHAEGA